MTRAVVIAALVLPNRGVPTICTVITNPIESESSERYLEQQMSAAWNKQTADARRCLATSDGRYRSVRASPSPSFGRLAKPYHHRST